MSPSKPQKKNLRTKMNPFRPQKKILKSKLILPRPQKIFLSKNETFQCLRKRSWSKNESIHSIPDPSEKNLEPKSEMNLSEMNLFQVSEKILECKWTLARVKVNPSKPQEKKSLSKNEHLQGFKKYFGAKMYASRPQKKYLKTSACVSVGPAQVVTAAQIPLIENLANRVGVVHD